MGAIKKYVEALGKLGQYIERRDNFAEQLQRLAREITRLERDVADLGQQLEELKQVEQHIKQAEDAYNESKRADAQVRDRLPERCERLVDVSCANLELGENHCRVSPRRWRIAFGDRFAQ